MFELLPNAQLAQLPGTTHVGVIDPLDLYLVRSAPERRPP
jgi:hypothetical protein